MSPSISSIAWPPGPPSGLTGWRFLLQMPRDMPATLASWQRQYGDLVHLRIWPEHQLIVTDPQLARELLVTHHDVLARWERGVRVLAQLHGNSVFMAEGAPWHAQRRALQPAFAPGQVEAFVPTMAAAAAEALAGCHAVGAALDVDAAVTALMMDVIIRRMFSCAIGEEARQAEAAVRALGRIANAEMFWPVSWFPEPEAFRPERFADTAFKPPRGAYMPFGAGPRVCLGQHLALAEMTVIAAMILQRFGIAPLPGQAAPRPVLNVTWRPDRPLRLQLTPLPLA